MAEQQTHKVTLIPGDGIGPEVTQAVVRILEATGVKFEWERFAAGAEAFEIHGEYIPTALYESIERNRVALKGPVTTPIGGGFKSINVTLRKKFDLFANLRPIRNLPGLDTKYPGVDLVIVRENTEGEYVGLEHEVVPGVVESIKVITEKGSTRIARFAFEYARKHGRKKIHSIHKANIMKLSDGLFLRCARQVAEEFPDILYGEHLIDNTCMQLVMNPFQYDTLLLENLYGDIVSDLCAGLVGGLGLAPGANLGVDCAIFEAVHGSAPDIAGKDVANPTALLQSAILMLRHLDETAAADKAQKALETVYARAEDADPRRGRDGGDDAVCRRGAGGNGVANGFCGRNSSSCTLERVKAMKNKIPSRHPGCDRNGRPTLHSTARKPSLVRGQVACGQRPVQREDLWRGRQVAAGHASAGADCEDDRVAGGA